MNLVSVSALPRVSSKGHSVTDARTAVCYVGAASDIDAAQRNEVSMKAKTKVRAGRQISYWIGLERERKGY